jgi:hypothetical protein
MVVHDNLLTPRDIIGYVSGLALLPGVSQSCCGVVAYPKPIGFSDLTYINSSRYRSSWKKDEL